SVRHAYQARAAVNDVGAQIREGRRTVIEANTAMDEIDRTGRRMGEVLDLVDQVAFHTHVLALNAAVEAGQAGVHRRGFGLIATEKRQLAQRWGKAARDIRQMILANDEATRAGSVLVDRTGVVLEAVASGVGKLSALVAAKASKERRHAEDIGVVNNSVVKMESMTGQNATLVEEATFACRAMPERAPSPLHQVDFFTMQHGGALLSRAMAARSESIAMAHSKRAQDALLDQLHA
ncbi:MAG: methyl-accepting chemotaxis protein, partial [Proteobacteria bacterium]|nr:methyl-accepting chemotaxis protein [Pseudomonadota bacterium]